MSDSHWGGGGLKGPLYAILGTAVVAAALIALFAWRPWVEPSEVEWLRTYEAWSQDVEATIDAGYELPRADCEATYDDEVGEPSQERLQPVSATARRGCEALTPAGWPRARAAVVRALVAAHAEALPPRRRQDYAQIAASSVGIRPAVYCWQPLAWGTLAEQYAVVRAADEVSLKGIADSTGNRIDLDPGVCATLGRYLRRIRPSPQTYQNFELAEALAVLTHQAEHLRAPSASEAEVECYAVQHVRPLVRAGWGPAFAHEIALHAWEISYLQLPPHFRTPACRDGRPLDRNPRSSAWP